MHRLKTVLTGLSTALLASYLVLTTSYPPPPGTVISSQASLDFLNTAGVPTTITSNVVDVVTAVIRSPSGLELTRVVAAGSGAFQETVGSAACMQGGSFVTRVDPGRVGGTT